MTSTESSDLCLAKRKALNACIVALCIDAGYEVAERSALETLTEIIQSYISELGRSGKTFAELSGRTQPMLNDVVLAMIEMGMDVVSLPDFAKNSKKTLKTKIPNQDKAIESKSVNPLSSGQKKSHPPHIPDHLPQFPDPHTYIKTATYRKPEADYRALREKEATQRRHTHRALTRFIAKTGKTHSLFPGTNTSSSMFPLIAEAPPPNAYLQALLPSEEEAMSMMDDRAEDERDKPRGGSGGGTSRNQDDQPDTESSQESLQLGVTPSRSQGSLDITDNPFTRPPKRPKVKKKVSSASQKLF